MLTQTNVKLNLLFPAWPWPNKFDVSSIWSGKNWITYRKYSSPPTKKKTEIETYKLISIWPSTVYAIYRWAFKVHPINQKSIYFPDWRVVFSALAGRRKQYTFIITWYLFSQKSNFYHLFLQLLKKNCSINNQTREDAKINNLLTSMGRGPPSEIEREDNGKQTGGGMALEIDLNISDTIWAWLKLDYT